MADNIEDNEYFLIDTSHIQLQQCDGRYLANFNRANCCDLSLLECGKLIKKNGGTEISLTVPDEVEEFTIQVEHPGNGIFEYSIEPDYITQASYGFALEDKVMFIDRLALKIIGSMEKGSSVRIKLNIKDLSQHDFVIKLNQEIQAAREMAAKNMITYYENSRSWKITAPFRRVAKEVKKLRGRR